MGGTVSERSKTTGQEEVGFYCWGTFPLSLIYFRDVKELHPGRALGFCREYVHEVLALVDLIVTQGDGACWCPPSRLPKQAAQLCCQELLMSGAISSFSSFHSAVLNLGLRLITCWDFPLIRERERKGIISMA